MPVTIVGGGLAGCEAAFQLAERGVDVVLVEMKPHRRTPAQSSDQLGELVCSNSMRGAAPARSRFVAPTRPACPRAGRSPSTASASPPR